MPRSSRACRNEEVPVRERPRQTTFIGTILVFVRLGMDGDGGGMSCRFKFVRSMAVDRGIAAGSNPTRRVGTCRLDVAILSFVVYWGDF